MSDVGDVNRAHMKQPADKLSMYIYSAERMLSQNATLVDRMAFQQYHSAANVVALGELIAQLRIENAALLEIAYGGGVDIPEKD